MEDNSIRKSYQAARKQYIYEEINDLSEEIKEIVLVASIPRWLDRKILSIIFPDAKNIDGIFNKLNQIRFFVEIYDGYIEMDRIGRQVAFEWWLENDPRRFKDLSETLANYFLGMAGKAELSSGVALTEWVYHLIGFNPKIGLQEADWLMEQVILARDLSFADQICKAVSERSTFLPDKKWSAYFASRLELVRSRFKSANQQLKTIISSKDPFLVAAAHRSNGVALAGLKNWSLGLSELRKSIRQFRKIGNLDNLIQTEIIISDVYLDFAENFGGLFEDPKTFSGPIHKLAYYLSRLPFWGYRLLARRFDFLPEIYGMNYQNWIILYLLEKSNRAIKKARRHNQKLNKQQGSNQLYDFEIERHLANLSWRMGQTNRAKYSYDRLAGSQLVIQNKYRAALIQIGCARVAIKQGQIEQPINMLEECKEVFEFFEDWQRLGEACQILSDLYLKQGDIKNSFQTNSIAISAFTKNGNLLHRTERIATYSNKLKKARDSSPAVEGVDEHLAWLKNIQPDVFQARFPRKTKNWFAGVNLISFLFFALALVLSTFTFTILEGEYRIASTAMKTPLQPEDVFLLFFFACSPLIALWVQKFVYLVLGMFSIYGLFPLLRIEESQPDQILIDEKMIEKRNWQGQKDSLLWEKVGKITIADRSLISTPDIFTSYTKIQSEEGNIEIEGITDRYRQLQEKIKISLADSKKIKEVSISFLNHTSTGIILGIAIIISLLLVYGVGITNEYCAVDMDPCPAGQVQSLHLSSVLISTNFLFWALFFLVSRIRIFSLRRAVKENRE